MDLSAQNSVDRALVDGVGGLEFLAQAPPGVGRLVRIPFYLEDASGGFDALFGQAIPIPPFSVSATHPVIAVRMISLPLLFPGVGPIAVMRTPVVSWAILRVVGFETFLELTPWIDNAPTEVSFANLSLGGGPTLFTHETFAPSRIYDGRADSLPGLRDYPILQAPNRVSVDVQAFGFNNSPMTTFSCNLVCEVLEDDVYGIHIPGPYARPGALARDKPSVR